MLKPWVRRLFRKDCFVCEGTGWTNPRYVNVDRLPCDACLGTGLRIVERAETNRNGSGASRSGGEGPYRTGRRPTSRRALRSLLAAVSHPIHDGVHERCGPAHPKRDWLPVDVPGLRPPAGLVVQVVVQLLVSTNPYPK